MTFSDDLDGVELVFFCLVRLVFQINLRRVCGFVGVSPSEEILWVDEGSRNICWFFYF